MRGRAIDAVGAIWILVAAVLGAMAVSDGTSSGQIVLAVAAALGVGSAAAALVFKARRRFGWSAVAFVVSAVTTPSVFFYPVNVVPLALAFAVMRGRSRSTT